MSIYKLCIYTIAIMALASTLPLDSIAPISIDNVVVNSYSTTLYGGSNNSSLPDFVLKALNKSRIMGMSSSLEGIIDKVVLVLNDSRVYGGVTLYCYRVVGVESGYLYGYLLYLVANGSRAVSPVYDIVSIEFYGRPLWFIASIPYHVSIVDFVDKMFIPLIDYIVSSNTPLIGNGLLVYSDLNVSSSRDYVYGLIGRLLLYETLYIDYSVGDIYRTPWIQPIGVKEASIIASVVADRFGLEPYIVEYVFCDRKFWFTFSRYTMLSTVDRLYRFRLNESSRVWYGIYYAVTPTYYHWPALVSRQITHTGRHVYSRKDCIYELLGRLSGLAYKIHVYRYDIGFRELVNAKRVIWTNTIIDVMETNDSLAYILVPVFGSSIVIAWCLEYMFNCSPVYLVIDYYNVLKTGYCSFANKIIDGVKNYRLVNGVQSIKEIFYPWLISCRPLVRKPLPTTRTNTTEANITVESTNQTLEPLAPGLTLPPNILVPMAIVAIVLAYILYTILQPTRIEGLSRRRVVGRAERESGRAREYYMGKTIAISWRHKVVLWFTKTLALLESIAGSRKPWETHREYGYRVKRKLGDKIHSIYNRIAWIYEKARYSSKTITSKDLEEIKKQYSNLEKQIERQDKNTNKHHYNNTNPHNKNHL